MEKQHTDALSEGYDRAMELLRACRTPEGFLATPTENANYRRIWGRDSCIISLAALPTGDEPLIEASRETLLTLARHQGPHGEIPSNLDPHSGRVSYGGTTGRVDADLWFVICCGQYWRATEDQAFLDQMCAALQRARHLLGCWEFNTRGLLYVPVTGDWADEYVQDGYVLYDQLLYLRAQRELAAIHRFMHGGEDHTLTERISRLRHLIRANYWFLDGDEVPDDVYHEILYKRGRRAAPRRCGSYWMPFFSPASYGYRFDAFANVLVSLIGVANDEQRRAVDQFLTDEIVPDGVSLLPAFHPVITPKDEDWDELQMTFSHTFKNQPYEYQNGGLWPMITGFYVADLAQRGHEEAARRFLASVHRANASEVDGQPCSFPEFLHGRELRPGGNTLMGWNAAAAILGQHALDGRPVLLSSVPGAADPDDALRGGDPDVREAARRKLATLAIPARPSENAIAAHSQPRSPSTAT
jgi:hypothetical protein